MFGPNVQIHGGNHTINTVGSYMKEVDDKKLGDDGYVIICDDVWIGAGSIILKGIKIGEGAVIGAGSVVVKDVPAYSIFTGVPNIKIREKWDKETIRIHKKKNFR